MNPKKDVKHGGWPKVPLKKCRYTYVSIIMPEIFFTLVNQAV